MNAAELDELLACYAIDALDAAERSAIDEHLRGHPEDRARVQQLRDAAGAVAWELGPPERVWEAIAAATFGREGLDGPRHRRSSWRRRLRFPRPVVVKPVPMVAAVAAVAACIVGALFLAPFDRGADAPGPNLARSARAAELTPGARSVALRRLDGRVVASAVVVPDGTGYLTAHLATLKSGRTYQLWAIVDDTRMISLGVLGSHPRVVGFSAVGNAGRLSITDEAAPGVPVTHRAPVASGALPPA